MYIHLSVMKKCTTTCAKALRRPRVKSGTSAAEIVPPHRPGTKERQIRLMTNSHKSQSEKLATGGGRETTAEKPDNN